jgi:hypothetical protein
LPALLLVATSVPLFLLAAVTESFVRESALGTAPRLAIAGVYTVALLAALFFVHRAANRRRVDTSWLGEVAEREHPRAQTSA